MKNIQLMMFSPMIVSYTSTNNGILGIVGGYSDFQMSDL